MGPYLGGDLNNRATSTPLNHILGNDLAYIQDGFDVDIELPV